MRPVLLPLLLCAACTPLLASDHGLVKWEHDPNTAFDRAKAENKYLWVYFTADWCPPCQQLTKGALSDQKVAAAATGLVCLLVDLTDRQHPDPTGLAQKYNVDSIPRMLFLKADGSVMGKLETREAEQMSAQLIAAAGGQAPGGESNIPWLYIVIGLVAAAFVWHGLQPRKKPEPSGLASTPGTFPPPGA
jgi:thiol-disulfide isomerase/thioredoxin